MARVFTDGAEFKDSLLFSSFTGTIETTIIRSGGASYRLGGSGSCAYTFPSALSEIYFRIGWRTSISGSNTICQWRNGTTVLGSLRINLGTHYLELYTGTSTLVATGTIPISADTFYLLEIRVKIADSGGALTVKVDGISDATFSGDTKPGSDTTITNILYLSPAGAVTYLDDLAMNDTTGGVDDSWCGDGKVILLTPNANGDSSDWVGSDGNSTDNYLLVDDFPHDTDTTYTESSTSSDYDLYNLTASGLSNVDILRVWPETRARDTVAAGGQIKLVTKTNSTEYRSSALTLTTSYTRIVGADYTVNPNTSSAWTVSELDAVQVGPEVV